MMIGDARQLIAHIVVVAGDVGLGSVLLLDTNDAAERVLLLANDVAVRVDPLDPAAVVATRVDAPAAGQRGGDHAVCDVVLVERRSAGCAEFGLGLRNEPAHGVVDEIRVVDR